MGVNVMSVFDRLHQARDRADGLDEETRTRMMAAWGLSEEQSPATAERPDAAALQLDYDRVQWQRKLRHILNDLPELGPRWDHLLTEARAKGFDEGWVRQEMRDEFILMIRRAVADRLFTETERRTLDRVRYLIGLSEAEAEAAYETVVHEAEIFFGEHVDRT